MGGIPFAFCTLLGCFFLLLGIFVHKIGAVGNVNASDKMKENAEEKM